MRDGLTHHESGDQMLDWAGFTTVGTKHKGVQAALVSQMVQHRDVGVHVVYVVGVGGIFAVRPLVRSLQRTNLGEGS